MNGGEQQVQYYTVGIVNTVTYEYEYMRRLYFTRNTFVSAMN
jgi:hypothetical protein